MHFFLEQELRIIILRSGHLMHVAKLVLACHFNTCFCITLRRKWFVWYNGILSFATEPAEYARDKCRQSLPCFGWIVFKCLLKRISMHVPLEKNFLSISVYMNNYYPLNFTRSVLTATCWHALTFLLLTVWSWSSMFGSCPFFLFFTPQKSDSRLWLLPLLLYFLR